MSKPILCVDFDGVIHQYDSPWTDAETITDGAVSGAMQWLWRAIDVFDVHIYSSRSKTEAGRKAMALWLEKEALNEWQGDDLIAKILCDALTFSSEKPPAFLTIDDRAVCFKGNWNDLDVNVLRQFKPWNKREVTFK